MLDLSSYTDKTFKIRFQINSQDTYSINNWNIDNIRVIASEDSVKCLLGYNVFIDNLLGLFTPDTTCLLPPDQVQ